MAYECLVGMLTLGCRTNAWLAVRVPGWCANAWLACGCLVAAERMSVVGIQAQASYAQMQAYEGKKKDPRQLVTGVLAHAELITLGAGKSRCRQMLADASRR